MSIDSQVIKVHTLARNYQPSWCSMSLSEAFESLDNAREFYHEWIREVRRKIPPNRLLEFDVTKDGWAPFCRFLDLPQPEEDSTFPKANEAAIFSARMRSIKADCWRKLFLYLLLIGGCVAVILAGV